MTECCCDDIIIEVTEEGIDGVGIASIVLVSTVGITKNYRINLTNGTYFDYSISDGSSIASISKTSSAGLVDTYTVALTSGETSTFEVTNGNGIASIVKTSTDNLTDVYTIQYTNGTTSTFSVVNGNSIASVSKVSTQVLTDTYEITYTDEDKSPDTFTVVNGRGITSIAKTSTSGLIDTYTVTYNDSSTSTFTVTNGEKGDKGDTGDTGNGIQSITLLSESGLVKTYRITMTDGTHFDFDVTDGEKGDTGETGATGNGIASIEKTETVGLVDTYTITMTDGTTTTFTVTNGSDMWGNITGTLSDQTDLQTALDNKAPVILNSASGGIASFADGSPAPVTALSVGIEPVQAGTGDPSPDNVRPITGRTGANIYRSGKCLISGTDLATMILANGNEANRWHPDAEGGAYYELYSGSSTRNKIYINNCFKENTQYTIVLTCVKNSSTSTGINVSVYYTDGTGTSLSLAEPNTKEKIIFVSAQGKTIDYIGGYYSTNATTYLYVDESGVYEGVLTEQELVPYVGATLPISWQAEAGTVYGGSLDVLTGQMTVNSGLFTFDGSDDEGWEYYPDYSDPENNIYGYRIENYFQKNYYAGPNSKTNLFTYSSKQSGSQPLNTYSLRNYNKRIVVSVSIDNLQDFKTFLGTNNLQLFVYYYQKPVDTVQLTPSQMQTLLGENHIWADTGDVSVTYRADSKLYIDQAIAESQRATRKMIADSATADGKAPKSLATGDLIIVGNELRKATESIGQGSKITDQRSTVATLADVIKALQQ